MLGIGDGGLVGEEGRRLQRHRGRIGAPVRSGRIPDLDRVDEAGLPMGAQPDGERLRPSLFESGRLDAGRGDLAEGLLGQEETVGSGCELVGSGPELGPGVGRAPPRPLDFDPELDPVHRDRSKEIDGQADQARAGDRPLEAASEETGRGPAWKARGSQGPRASSVGTNQRSSAVSK